MHRLAPGDLGTSLLLLLVTALPFCTTQNTYYVTPTPDTPCQEDPCHTLSEYVSKAEQYFTSNATMVLLPGEHGLQENVTVRNIGRLAFISNSSSSPADVSRIICTDATLTFTNMYMLEITALEFHSCTIQLYTTSAVFKNSSFKNSTSDYGGAVYAHSSMITFEGETRFESNSAAGAGGGIFAEESNLTFLGNTTFINNKAFYEGGGGISIVHCDLKSSGHASFISNSASAVESSGGGGISAYHSGLNFDSENNFLDNSAVNGGGILVYFCTVSFSGVSQFINNSAMGLGLELGGGAYVMESTVRFADNSSFIYNSAGGIGGGVFVSFSTVSFGDDNTFICNSAQASGGGVYVSSSSVSFADDNSLINNSAKMDGGGVCISESTVSFATDDNFIGNSAKYGGGVYAADSSTVSFADNNSFINNSAEYGGGLCLEGGNTVGFADDNSFITNSAKLNGGGVCVDSSTVSFGRDGSFTHNSAGGRGGGIYLDDGSSVSLGEDSGFMGNSAAYYGGCVAAAEDSTIDFGGGCMFLNNLARYGGCIFVQKSNFISRVSGTFSWNLAIASNQYNGVSVDVSQYVLWYGGAILALSSNLIIGGSLELKDNSAGYGGAIYVNVESKIYLLPNTMMSFQRNLAQHRGGAFFVEDDRFTYCNLDSFRETNVQDAYGLHDACFIQMLEYQYDCDGTYPFPSDKFDDQGIELQFHDNVADEAGSVLHGGNIKSCQICSSSFPWGRDIVSVTGEVAFKTWANTSNNLISSDPYHVCICVDNHPDCNQSIITRGLFPGSTVRIPVVAFGQLKGIVPAVIHTYVSKGITLNDLETTQQSTNTCSNLQYTASATDLNIWNEATLTLYVDEPCSILGLRLEILVEFLPCPPGFTLSREGTCECEQRLHKYEVDCDINDQSMLCKDNAWVGFDQQSQGLILHPHCPFDYCKQETGSVNFTLNNTDLQCNQNRSGHLCGACQHGFSLAVGGSRCLPCSNKFLTLLIPFAFAGLALVVFLFVCKVTVAAGTISGLIFFANVVTVNQSILFPSGNTNILTVFIAWLNLDLGIETCFFDGMDAYSMTWLQFVFPLYIWLLVGLITVICNVSTTAARILGSTNPIAILATLFLLSYTKLLRTIFAAFSFTTLEYPDGERKIVWLYDGNIGYLDKNDGRHIALFLASLLVFLFLFLPYTLFLVFGQCILPRLDLNKLTWFSWSNYIRIKSFLDAHHAPYKDKHRYWIGLLLVLRLILFLISAIVDIKSPQDPHVNLLVIIISTSMLGMWVWSGVYKKWYLNVLESSFILNLILVAAATLYAKHAGGSQSIVFHTSVSVAFSTFIGIVIYHVYQRLRDSRAWRNIVRKHNERKRERDHGWQREDAAEDEEMEDMLPQAAPKPPSVTYVDIPTEERRQMRPITPPLTATKVNNVPEPVNHWQREDAAAHEEMEGTHPQVTPSVSYIDIPTERCREMRPITPPSSANNLTEVCEPLDHWQRDNSFLDEEIHPQNTPPVTNVDIPAGKCRETRPITPPPPINFTDLREPLDLLTQ